MAAGSFDLAWKISDAVLNAREGTTQDDPRLPYHLRWVWDGRAFDRKRVLVRCYHGLGDTLQFGRYLAPLRQRVARLTLEVQPELVALLARVNGPDELVPFQPEAPLPASECDLEIMELSHALRLAPNTSPYINLPNTRRSGRVRVGLCWKTSATWSPERSVPACLLTPILAQKAVEFVSLQRGEIAPGLPDTCPEAIVDTARLIAKLDLVISVDTMVAHLAGAIGVPVWLLLKHEPDWRWRAGGRGSVWYGRFRKYQQEEAGCWEAPISHLVADLAGAITGELSRSECTFAPYGNA